MYFIFLDPHSRWPDHLSIQCAFNIATLDLAATMPAATSTPLQAPVTTSIGTLLIKTSKFSPYVVNSILNSIDGCQSLYPMSWALYTVYLAISFFSIKFVSPCISSLPLTWVSLARWQRTQFRRRKVAWGRAQCQDRRRHPGKTRVWLVTQFCLFQNWWGPTLWWKVIATSWQI